MSSYGSWSVKGIDDRARAVAKEKARLEGVTLGDYINSLLLQGHSEAGPRDLPDFHQPSSHAEPSPLDGLTRRIEAAEARSTLAITGIDQSVLGLLARLENTEQASSSMAAEVEAIIDELRETHEALQSKVQQIETDDTADQNLQAMKALEQALGKLATHVYEESGLAQDETSAIKGRMESGFADLSERVEGMEFKVESTLADAAKRVEKAVGQSELRAEGTSRHLSERFTAIESSVATKLAKVDDVDTRMTAVEGDVSGAITSMEGTLIKIQDRLNRAENTTDAALKALEHTFASLDERIETVAAHANPERAQELRQEFETRFENLATDLRAGIDATRAELANEIEQAAAGDNPELMGRLESTIDTLKERLSAGEERSSRALESVSEQVGRISAGLDTRLRSVEQREEHVIDKVSAQMTALADQFDQRVADSESRSAIAIEQVGEQVATAISRVQARQETATRSVEDTIATAQQKQDARLSDALSNMSDRLSEMQSQTISFVSPVQKAIASLAARLEAVEDFNAPPHATAPQHDLPTIPDIKPEIHTPEDVLDAALSPDSPAEPEAAPANDDDLDFVAGLPDIDEGAGQVDATTEYETDPETWATGAKTVDEDYATTTASGGHEYRADIPEEADTDPLAQLSSDLEAWDDGRDETRDSDIFADDIAAEPELIKDQPVQDDNISQIEDPTLADLTVDEDATDYLARARHAAIAAAAEIPAKASKLRATSKSAKPGKAKATKTETKGAGRIPLYAAASVLVIATTAAGVHIALRGKQEAPTQPIAIATVDTASSTETAAPQPTLEGVTYAEDAAPVDAELFEEEGSASPDQIAIASSVEPTIAAAAIPAPRDPLPVVPKRLTLERSAVEGNPIAQYQWGEAQLIAGDYTQGPDYVRRAAQQGLPAAQYRLAKLHENGLGVPRDLAEARIWTEKAARGGNVKAMHDLAVFFADGEGGPQSYAAAVEWFRKAAEFGVVDSQYNLAVLYENGLGISPSQTEALYWYEIAARNGDASAPGNVNQIRDALSLSDAQTAQRRAATWAAAALVPASNGTFGPQIWESGLREQVLAIQTVLNGLNYETGTPDGLIGPGTRTAIRAFQADAGLPTDGQISDELVDAMNKQAQDAA